jgi:hypothetical protein
MGGEIDAKFVDETIVVANVVAIHAGDQFPLARRGRRGG